MLISLAVGSEGSHVRGRPSPSPTRSSTGDRRRSELPRSSASLRQARQYWSEGELDGAGELLHAGERLGD